MIVPEFQKPENAEIYPIIKILEQRLQASLMIHAIFIQKLSALRKTHLKEKTILDKIDAQIQALTHPKIRRTRITHFLKKEKGFPKRYAQISALDNIVESDVAHYKSQILKHIQPAKKGPAQTETKEPSVSVIIEKNNEAENPYFLTISGLGYDWSATEGNFIFQSDMNGELSPPWPTN